MEKNSVISVIATPLGNLEDISIRAQKTLAEVDLILCEDTRMTKKLLSLLDITADKLESYHEHNEHKKADEIIERIKSENLHCGLVSDAGTPCISDPGFKLISAARSAGIEVIPVPGASALTSIVSISGLPNDRVSFVGFLPKQEKKQRDEIHSWNVTPQKNTIVFYESPKRIQKTLLNINEIYPNAVICIGRELTKKFEESHTLPICDAVKRKWEQKGEYAIHLNPNQSLSRNKLFDYIKRIARYKFIEGKTLKTVLQELSDLPVPKNELYQTLLELNVPED